MGDISAIGSAVYRLVDAATALSVYSDRAPQGTVAPYVIFQRQEGRDEYTFTGNGINADYVVKVVSNAYSPSAAQTAYEAIHTAINGGGTVTVTGYNLLRFERQTTIQYQEPAGFWHVGGLYSVQVWEA